MSRMSPVEAMLRSLFLTFFVLILFIFQIHDEKLVVVAKAKCGTFDNIDHIAGGGDVEIYDEKALPWKETSRKGSNSMGSVTLETLSSVGSEGLAF